MRKVAVVLAVFAICAFAQEVKGPVPLITADDVRYWENAANSLKPGERRQLARKEFPFLTVVQTEGPKIEIVMPKSSEVGSPFELWVKFATQNSAPDLNSIHVSAKKWMFNSFRFERDITDRVRPYVGVQEIHVAKTMIPAGRYDVTLQVSDVEKNVSKVEMVLEITEH